MVALTLSHQPRHASEEGWAAYAVRRFSRLYVPFLLWSLIYLGLRLLKHLVIKGASSPILLGPATLLTGTAHHLWFLPFAFLVTLFIYPARRVCARSTVGWQRVWGAVLFSAGLALSFMPCPVAVDATAHPWTYFTGMSWSALPAVFYGGAAVALLPAFSGAVTVWAGGAGLAMVGVLLQFEIMQAPLHCLGGLLLWIVAHNRFSFPNPALLATAGAMSFSLYLVHVAVVECLQVISKKMGAAVSIQTDLAVGLTALALSIFLIVLGRRFKCLAPLFPF